MTVATAEIGHNRPPSHLEMLAEKFSPLGADIEALATRANDTPRAVTSDSDLDAIGSLVKDSGALARRLEVIRKAEKDPHLVAGKEVDSFFAVFAARVTRIQGVFQGIADEHARKVAAEARRKAEAEAKAAREEQERQAEIARRAEEANRLKTADKHHAKADALEDKAVAAEAVATASAADLTRQRMYSGVLSTAKTEWAFEITDYDSIPLERLKPYLKRDAVEAAIRALVKLHQDKSPLPGVRIFQDVKAVFR